jgi:hypothetical protein
LASLLDLCGDDWSWLDTLRSVAGEKRCISFAWAEGRRQISGSRQICEGLSVLGEGDWVLTPPSREPHGTQHAYLNPEAEALAGGLLMAAHDSATAILWFWLTARWAYSVIERKDR